MTVGEVLSKARKERGLTQAEVAVLLGKTQPTISEWECNKSLPHTDEVREVARVYGVEPAEILPMKPRRETEAATRTEAP